MIAVQFSCSTALTKYPMKGANNATQRLGAPTTNPEMYVGTLWFCACRNKIQLTENLTAVYNCENGANVATITSNANLLLRQSNK